MRNLTDPLWWRAAGARALRTMLVIASPYVPTVLYGGDIWIMVSSIGFAGVASLVTSLFGIAETTDGSVSWYWALGERVVKTASQSLLVLFGTATMFEQVRWDQAWQLVGTAVLGTVLAAFMKGLPEVPSPPAAPATVAIESTVVNNAGQAEQVVTEAPVSAVIEVGSSDVSSGPQNADH